MPWRSSPSSSGSTGFCGDSFPGRPPSEASIPLHVSAAWPSVPAGLDSAGLRALGFDDRVIAQIGRGRDPGFRWPLARPAWVLLRQRQDPSRVLEVVQVAPRRELLRPDSTTLVVRALAGLRLWRNDHPRTVYPAVLEIIPAALHLDRQSVAALPIGSRPQSAALSRSPSHHRQRCERGNLGCRGQASPILPSSATNRGWPRSGANRNDPLIP